MAKTVRAPDGARWRVGRRWLPWRFRWRSGRAEEALHLDGGAEGCLDAGLDDLFVGIFVVAFIGLFFIFVMPVLIALIELTLLVLLVVSGVVVRIALRRPWLIDATRLDAYGTYTLKAVGWRRSGQMVEAAARRLSQGRPPIDA
ncbi:MAG TPA: hypothetical protein VM938_00510 [Acidimicrobiales bacterium]|nr:hypothetical protein [Acidimicrobiales bacterium]